MTMVCEQCHHDGEDPVIRYTTDQFGIEVAAKRADGKTREAQVTTFRLCKRHAVAYVENIRAGYRGGALPKPWDLDSVGG